MVFCQKNKVVAVVMYSPSVQSSKTFLACILSETVISKCLLRVMYVEEWLS